MVERGGVEGIRTPDRTFWLWPECDDDGLEVRKLPPFPPREIRRVTVETPDLTQFHADTLKELFDKRLAYFTRTKTLEAYLKDSPGLRNPPTDDQFMKGRTRILVEPLEVFAQDPLTRQLVWDRHGTREIANQHGYLGDVWETELGEDGSEHRVSSSCSYAESLRGKLKQARWPNADFDSGWRAANAIVNKLRFVMIYDDAPAERWIYLIGMKESVHLPRQPDVALAVDVRARIESHSIHEHRLILPGWEVALKEIQKIKLLTAKTQGDVSELLQRKKQRERKSHVPGAKAKAKWYGKERELAEAARHARKFLNSDRKSNGIKRGKMRLATEQMKSWWAKKYQGAELEGFLRDKQYGWLRRVILKDDWHSERNH